MICIKKKSNICLIFSNNSKIQKIQNIISKKSLHTNFEKQNLENIDF